MCTYLIRTDFFATEKVRHDFFRNYLKYVSELADRETYEYLSGLSVEELKDMSSVRADFEKVPDKYKELGEFSCNDFIDRVFEPLFDEKFVGKCLKKYYSRTCENPYHIDDVDFWGNSGKVQKFIKELDEENPLVKYEYSPGFREKILDEGYDGVNEDRYNKHIKEYADLTDEEMYVLGKYSSRDAVLETSIKTLSSAREFLNDRKNLFEKLKRK